MLLATLVICCELSSELLTARRFAGEDSITAARSTCQEPLAPCGVLAVSGTLDVQGLTIRVELLRNVRDQETPHLVAPHLVAYGDHSLPYGSGSRTENRSEIRNQPTNSFRINKSFGTDSVQIAQQPSPLWPK